MIRIYGIAERLVPLRESMSDAINRCMVEALAFPENKRAQRFIPLERENFYYPEGRSDAYTVIELSLMEGRSIETRKRLIQLLFKRFKDDLDIDPVDLEITIHEAPACNWGFRGTTGDEAKLNYEVKV